MALALAPLVATVAWAAPLGGQGPTAELSYGTHHLVLSDGKVTLTETVTFEEAQPDEGYVLTATLHALDDDGSDRGAITVSGELFEASASIVPADDERVRYLVASFGPSSPPQSHRGIREPPKSVDAIFVGDDGRCAFIELLSVRTGL